MGVVIGTGIEDRDRAAADDVTHRALEGERARIIGDHGTHPRRDLGDAVGLEIESLVERDVVAHEPAFICAVLLRTRSGRFGSRRGRTPTAIPTVPCSPSYKPAASAWC